MKLATRLIGSALILGLFATSGCSDDDDEIGTGAKGGSSGRGGSGKGGKSSKAGSGGTTGKGGSSGSGGTLGGSSGTAGKGGTAGSSGRGGSGGTSPEGGQAGNGEAGNAGVGGESGGGGAAGDAMVERGRYLVNNVAACIDCHTPRNPDGTLDRTRLLAGNPAFIDLDDTDDAVGLVPTPNLTPDGTGLRDWTDNQIKNAFLNGEDEDGGALVPIMPYYVFHNMRQADADAIVAYLRSVPAVENEIPERQPLPTPITEPADPVPASAIPESTLEADDPDFDRAQNGRYLAGFIGTCMECHTATAPSGSAVPIDVDRLFAGGRVFMATALGLSTPPYPADIFSRNITPDETGIADLDVNDIVRVIREGVDDEGDRICPPMPSGPMMPFAGITASDAVDIALYLKSIEPVESDEFPECTPPEEGGGGASGAGGGG